MLTPPTQAGAATASPADRNVVLPATKSGEAALLTLNSEGMIRDCDRAGEALFGYRRSELAWRPVAMLLPELAEFELVQGGQANPRLRYFCRIGRSFRAVTQEGKSFACAICLNLLDNTGSGRLSLIVRPALEHTAGPGGEYAAGDTMLEPAMAAT